MTAEHTPEPTSWRQRRAARTDAWVRRHPQPWRLLRRARWRGFAQGVALTLLAIFFTRWLLLAAGIVLLVVGIGRLVWRRRDRERWSEAPPWSAADAQAEAQATEALRRAQAEDPDEGFLRRRIVEHERAIADFNARLERAVVEEVEQAR